MSDFDYFSGIYGKTVLYVCSSCGYTVDDEPGLLVVYCPMCDEEMS